MTSLDLATRQAISQSPLTRDPWEERQVEVRKSDLEQAGDGLFAKEGFTRFTHVQNVGYFVEVLNWTIFGNFIAILAKKTLVSE